MWIRLGGPLALVLLTGCGGETAAPATPYQAVLDDKQIMSWVLDPATDVVWGAAGSILTREGEQSLAPVDDAGWDAVRNAAATVTETGNLLMMPGRSRGADWDEIARGLVSIGQNAISAAEAHDEPALFDVGGQLYNVCLACHQAYMLNEQPPPT